MISRYALPDDGSHARAGNDEAPNRASETIGAAMPIRRRASISPATTSVIGMITSSGPRSYRWSFKVTVGLTRSSTTTITASTHTAASTT